MDGVLFPTGTSLPSGFWNDTTTHSAGSQPQSEVSVLLSAECQDSAAQRHNVAVQGKSLYRVWPMQSSKFVIPFLPLHPLPSAQIDYRFKAERG